MKLAKIFFLGALIFPIVSFSAEINFSRTLKLGMSGADVLELQKTLNLDTDTRVAEAGPGSKGNETSYFGLATKQAVVRFQEKYRNDVLVPVGLSSGTGFFGEKTRAKMLEVVKSQAVTATVPTTTSSTLTNEGAVTVMFPSRYSGKAGTTITLSGDGFTSTDNTIYFGDKYATLKAKSVGGAAITFSIPSIPKGIYSLWVKNSKGESNKDAFFVVLDGVTPEPKINAIMPEKIGRGGTVTITGEGFTTANNMIRTGVSVVEGVPSSDGQTLTFAVPQNLFTNDEEDGSSFSGTFLTPVSVYVINENGVSNGKNFTLAL